MGDRPWFLFFISNRFCLVTIYNSCNYVLALALFLSVIGVLISKVLDLWGFLADSLRSWLNSDLPILVGVAFLAPFSFTDSIYLRPTVTKFYLLAGFTSPCMFEESSTLGGDTFLGDLTKCSFCSLWGKAPKDFLEDWEWDRDLD